MLTERDSTSAIAKLRVLLEKEVKHVEKFRTIFNEMSITLFKRQMCSEFYITYFYGLKMFFQVLSTQVSFFGKMIAYVQ